MANPFYKIGPQKTPKIIQIFLLLISIASFFCALQVTFFPHLSLQYWLTLSWQGMREGFFWQPISYLFLVQADGISISFFFNLVFHLYLLWVFGTSIVERCGNVRFLILFFVSGLVASFFGLSILSFSHPFYQLSGNSIVLYSLLTSWVILNPKAELRLFFAIPFKATWLILGVLGLTLLMAFADWDFVTFVSYFSGSLFGYLYTLCLYRLHSPFIFLHRMERKIFDLFRRHKEKNQNH
jgi:membrane associated rhomboid family serine protease